MGFREDRAKQFEIEQASQKEHRSNYLAKVRRIRKDIRETGLMAVTYQLEYVKSNNISDEKLSHSDLVMAFEDAIQQHKNKCKQ